MLVLAASCGDAKNAGDPGGEPTAEADPTAEHSGPRLGDVRAGIANDAKRMIEQIRELETTKDVTCWTSFRQLDNFIASKQVSEFAALTKIEAVKALARAVWAAASVRAQGPEVTVADLEAVFSMEAELTAAKRAELEKFADDLGWQQFRDYRTTSEHWRVLLSVAQDELAMKPSLRPLDDAAMDRLALTVTRLSLSLLTESGAIATEARTPLIEAEHVRKAFAGLLKKHAIPEAEVQVAQLDDAGANAARTPLTAALIGAKITALRHYNASTDDLHAELNKLTSVPLTIDAADRMVGELMSMARFFAKGYEPMRADNYLADGNFAPAKLQPKAYIDAAHVENITQQIFPYLMLPNGDVKLRFEPRPGTLVPEGLDGQDVSMTDHSMNAVRDTAIHWVVLKRVWQDSQYAMDPFAAEYVSELISIVATFYLLRAQTLAKRASETTITPETIGKVRDVRYVQVMPGGQEAAQWTAVQQAEKARVLAEYTKPLFVDVTAAWGLNTAWEPAAEDAAPGDSGFDIQRVMGAGIAVGDVDADGFTDLFISGEGQGRLWLNRGGTRFEDVTEAWGVPTDLSDSRGPLFFDADADGDLDLFVARSRSPSLLLRNDGGKLSDVAASAGLKTGSGAHVATAFDYDADGDLDLYLGYYGAKSINDGASTARNLPSLDGRNGTPNQLFRNDGGSFSDVSAAAGVDDAGWTLAASAFDYDLDGDLDLYLANDFGANPLFENDGKGTFTDVALDVGASDRGSGMNVSFADLDGNGAFDVFVSNIDMFSKNIKIVFPSDASTVKLSDRILRSFQYLSGNKLYFNQPRSRGPGREFEAREQAWFEPGDRGWGWAGLFFDVDLDGDEDFYLANGWIPGSPAHDQNNQMFVRDQDVFYQLPTNAAAEGFAGDSRSAVAFDMDNDGDLDLAVNNFRQAPRLLRNEQATDNRFVGLQLVGPAGNPSAAGAVVELTAGGSKQRRVVTCGDGYLGQMDRYVHFGVGTSKSVSVTVTLPGQPPREIAELAAGEIHRVEL